MRWGDYDDRLEFEDTLEEDEELLEAELDIPDVWWKDDIAKIEDPKLREREIQAAKKSLEEKRELDEKFKSGQIDEFGYWAGNERLHLKDARAATRSGLASVGLDYGKIEELSEDYDILVTGDLKLIDANDRVNKLVKDHPQAAQELADRMFEEGRLSEEAHKFISGKVKRYKQYLK